MQTKWSDLFSPTKKQLDALAAIGRSEYVLYGGARGGSKSHLLRWWLLQFLIEMYKRGFENARVMLACESYPVLQDRQVSKIDTEFPRWLGEVKTTKTEGLGYYVNPEFGGGAIMLRNLDNPSKYMGAEFAAIGVDQIEKIKKDTFDILVGSKRWPGFNKTKFVATANPGGYGWVKQLWIDRNFPPEMAGFEDKFEFVQSLPKDNPYLDESYWAGLKMLPERIQKAWIDGDWNVFSGQAFPQFNDNELDADSHICTPFEIPEHWLKFMGVDWGFTEPFVCLWIAKDPITGRIFIYNELTRRSLADRWQAKTIRDMTMPQEHITMTFADPSMWSGRHQKDNGTITSSADEYANEGVYLQKGDNNRLSGKRKVDRLLEKLPDGKPGLMVFSTCKEFRRTFQYLMLNEPGHGDTEDVASKGTEDHHYDALRYAISSLRSDIDAPKKIATLNPYYSLKGI